MKTTSEIVDHGSEWLQHDIQALAVGPRVWLDLLYPRSRTTKTTFDEHKYHHVAVSISGPGVISYLRSKVGRAERSIEKLENGN